MQTVLEHSSSRPARQAAAAWVGAYDAALALGAAVSRAQLLADAAYRATATVTGLPTGDWRHPGGLAVLGITASLPSRRSSTFPSEQPRVGCFGSGEGNYLGRAWP
jgi:hypothetical protein